MENVSSYSLDALDPLLSVGFKDSFLHIHHCHEAFVYVRAAYREGKQVVTRYWQRELKINLEQQAIFDTFFPL